MDDPVFEIPAFALERRAPPPEVDQTPEPAPDQAPRPDVEEDHFSLEDERACEPSLPLELRRTPAPVVASAPDPTRGPARAPSPESDSAPSLSREEAAARLGCSPRSIGRLVESGNLTARRDERGRPWFAVEEVDRLALERTRHARPDAGELAARAFALFSTGARPRDLVVAEKLSPDAALELHARWVELGGGVVIDGARAHRLADALGMSRLDLDIVERALVALRRVARALHAPCASCGREAFVGEARRYGPSWRCQECERADDAPVRAWSHDGA